MNTAVQLNVIKCILSVRRTKSERINVFFYEILSPAGLFASRMAFSPDDDPKSEGISVESEAEGFLAFTENLFQRQAAYEKTVSPSVLSSIEQILSEILTAEAVRESMDSPRGGLKSLEEEIREEMFSRLGYRATAYLKAERKDEDSLASYVRQEEAAKVSEGAQQPEKLSFLIPCAPCIDPVKGTPIGSLERGDAVLVRLPEDETSAIREKLQRADPDFNGVVKSDVISVHKDKHGNYTLLVRLSDEFNGVITLEGNSRIRTTHSTPKTLILPGTAQTSRKQNGEVEKSGPPSAPPFPSAGVFFLMFGAMAALLAVLVFIRLFR